MRGVILEKVVSLSAESIDALSSDLAEKLLPLLSDKRMLTRVRLYAEEVLLRWRDHFGEDARCAVTIKKRLAVRQLTLSVAGERFDPRESGDECPPDEKEVKTNLLTMLGLAPQYEYENGVNTVLFRLAKRQKHTLMPLCFAICAAVALGVAGQFAPESARAFISSDIITPIFSAFLRALSTLAGPMMFLSVVWGVYNIGDTALLGQIGGKMVRKFMITLFLTSMLATIMNIWLYTIQTARGASGGASAFGEIFELLLSVIPANIVEPFYTGNAMQIVFCSLCIGVAMLALSRKTTVLASMVEQSNYVVQLIMNVIAKLVPLFIFLSVLNLTLSDDLAVLLSTLRFFAYFLVTLFALCALFTVSLGLRHRVNPLKLIKKVSATLIITITTASSSAAFSTNLNDCKQRLGIDQRLANLGVPLGQVLFKVGDAVLFVVIALFMANLYSVPITVSFIVITCIIAPILSVASPTVPGGSITVFTILFTQLGIPLEAVALATVINTLVDFPVTAANIYCLQMELGIVAGKLRMLDDKRLKSA